MRKYLENIRALDLLIESKLEQEREIRAMLTATTASVGNGMPRLSSPNHDKMGMLIAELIELQEELNSDIDRFVDMKKKLLSFLKQLPLEERTFIESYYFRHKSISYIASQLHLCRRSVYNLRDRAIENLEKVCTICTP